MKRDEKNAQTRQRIIGAAMKEFSECGYEDASMNHVKDSGGLSKGILYHYFTDKDDLYLTCVQSAFSFLTEYLRSNLSFRGASLQEDLQDYFSCRIRFYREHPRQASMIARVLFRPPRHLAARLKEIRQEYDAYTVSLLRKLLEGKKLRKPYDLDAVTEDFRTYMDLFWAFSVFSSEDLGGIEDRLEAYESQCARWLDIFLYGVLEKKEG